MGMMKRSKIAAGQIYLWKRKFIDISNHHKNRHSMKLKPPKVGKSSKRFYLLVCTNSSRITNHDSIINPVALFPLNSSLIKKGFYWHQELKTCSKIYPPIHLQSEIPSIRNVKSTSDNLSTLVNLSFYGINEMSTFHLCRSITIWLSHRPILSKFLPKSEQQTNSSDLSLWGGES